MTATKGILSANTRMKMARNNFRSSKLKRLQEMNRTRHIFSIISAMLLLSILSPASGHAIDNQKLHTFVSILPQAYFVERIGGEYVDIEVMVAPGQSPETYAPTPRQMSDLDHAEVYFAIGLPFENQLLRKIREIFRDLDIVSTQSGIALRAMEPHGEGHEHEPGASDPHVWLDPIAVKTISKNICDELTKLDPAHQPYYEKNLTIFQAELDSINAAIADRLEPYKGRHIFVFHPVYGYFADRYGLEQTAVEIEGKEPSAKQLASFIDMARADSVTVIFVQPQFSTKTAETIASAIGGTVIKVDPLSRDYLNNLGNIADRLAEGLGGK